MQYPAFFVRENVMDFLLAMRYTGITDKTEYKFFMNKKDWYIYNTVTN